MTIRFFYLTCLWIIKHFFFFVLSFTLPPSDSKPESLEAHKIKTAFFTHPTLTEIGRRLVSHYFLLTEEELAMWEEDPESFGNSISPDTQPESKCPDLSGPAELTVFQNSEDWPVLQFMKSAMSLWVQASSEFIV